MLKVVLVTVLLSAWAVPAAAEDFAAVATGYRFGGWPDFVVGTQFADHQPVYGHGMTFEYSFGKLERHWNVGLVFASMLTPPGYWRGEGAQVDEAVYLETPLDFAGLYAAHRWVVDLGAGFSFLPAVGGGVLYIMGDAHTTELIPGCEGKVTSCGRWRQVSRQPVDWVTRFMPALLLTASFAYAVTDSTTLMVDAGLINMPFAGISVQQRLGFLD